MADNVAVTDTEWNDVQADLRAQLALETRLGQFDLWQVYRACDTRWVCGIEVPAGWYYAAHWRVGEPPAVGADLEELERAAMARMREMREMPPELERSVMSELLTDDEVRQYQVGPGRWFLPGTPP